MITSEPEKVVVEEIKSPENSKEVTTEVTELEPVGMSNGESNNVEIVENKEEEEPQS